MEATSLSLLDTLSLIALLPSLFAMLLLLVLGHNKTHVFVPVVFFMTLSCSFLQELIDVVGLDVTIWRTILVWIETMQPAMCFLLIMQLWRDEFPRGIYWFILALPIIGGSSLVYASFRLDEACMLGEYRLPAEAFRTLYQLFATSLLFLLLMAHVGHVPMVNSEAGRYRSHRYWLILALVVSFLLLLGFDLLMLTGGISVFQNEMIHVILRIGFLYLVLTSLFRVFDKVQLSDGAAAAAKWIDPEVIAQIEQAMAEGRASREMGFNREKFAAKLELPEHVLSRALNQEFGKNFNEYVNSYRIEEAKGRLTQEDTSITVIAFEVGFSSIASFNRVFKAMVECSPTQYRANHTAS